MLNIHTDLQDSTLLIVDDNLENLEVLFNFLTQFGGTVLVAQSGEDALEIVEETPPDLILLDIMMPGLDGFETCRRLKADDRTAAIPVLFITALSETEQKVKGFELGGVDYITKPFQQEEVLARVKTHLMLRKLQQDLQVRNRDLQAALERERGLLERERKLMEDLRLNLSISLPHELRTPLNAMLGYARFLTDRQALPALNTILEYGNAIYQNGQRLHRLIQNSLLYANLKLVRYASEDRASWQRECALDAQNFITSVARQKARTAGRADDLRVEVQTARLCISPQNLEKILTELLDNAFKFSPSGTPVTLDTTINGNLYVLTITDCGHGMSRDQIANIGAYMQFGRAEQEQQGAGLGLIIAYLLTRLEGGMLSVDSQLQQGTTASVVLNRELYVPLETTPDVADWFVQPAGPEAPTVIGYTRLGGADAPEPSDERHAFRILVLDDIGQNCQFVTNLLVPVGFEVFEAQSSLPGWNTVLEGWPDVIVTDVSMLEAGGFNAFQQLEQTDLAARIKTIVIADKPVENAYRERLTMLADTLLTPPVAPQQLWQALEVHLGLEWHYAGPNDAPALVAPPESELQKLHELTLQGHISGLLEHLDTLEQTDEQYAPFVEKLRRFARAFQIGLIRQFLAKYFTP